LKPVKFHTDQNLVILDTGDKVPDTGTPDPLEEEKTPKNVTTART